MSKKLFTLLTVIFFMTAQEKLSFSEFKLGSLSPKDAESGLYFSVGSGKMFDANLGYNLELGYYTKTYQKFESYPADDGFGGFTTKSKKFEQSSTYIPAMVKLNFVNELNATFLIKADAGIGYGFLWNNSIDYTKEPDLEKSNFFSGFIWNLGADIGLQISETGSVYGGVFYNGGELTGDHREEAGLPTFNSKDMSGVGFRLTIRIDGLGLF